MTLPDPVTYAIPGFVMLVLAEMVVAWAKDRRRYEPKDTLTSLALGTGSTVAGVITGAPSSRWPPGCGNSGCSRSVINGGGSSSPS